MTKWLFLFLLALILILTFRYFSFSFPPKEDISNCADNTIASKLEGYWDLNRVGNFSGLEPFFEKNNINNYSIILNRLLPFLLSKSQLLRIDFCSDEITISYNYFRQWVQYNFSFLQNTEIRSSDSLLISGHAAYDPEIIKGTFIFRGMDIKQEIYLDGGELIRAIDIKGSNKGIIKFYYRKYE